MSEIGKKKEINFGITDELKNFLNDWTNRTFESAENLNKEKKIGTDAKQMIVEITKRELEKVDTELHKDNITNDEWFRLMDKIDKLSDLVRWF